MQGSSTGELAEEPRFGLCYKFRAFWEVSTETTRCCSKASNCPHGLGGGGDREGAWTQGAFLEEFQVYCSCLISRKVAGWGFVSCNESYKNSPVKHFCSGVWQNVLTILHNGWKDPNIRWKAFAYPYPLSTVAKVFNFSCLFKSSRHCLEINHTSTLNSVIRWKAFWSIEKNYKNRNITSTERWWLKHFCKHHYRASFPFSCWCMFALLPAVWSADNAKFNHLIWKAPIYPFSTRLTEKQWALNKFTRD